MNGVVKMYRQDKGFGFINYENQGRQKEIFFHVSRVVGIKRDFEKGDMVDFEINETGVKGPEAISIRFLAKAEG